MSIAIMTKVWSGGPKDQGMLLVLLAMADFADDTGRCWPAMETIAEKARMTERNARRVVRKLEDAGYLETHENRGRNATNMYVVKPQATLKPDNLSAPDKTGHLEHENRTSETEKPDICDIKPDTGAPLTVKNHQGTVKEPSDARECEFEEFWKSVPRKVGKGAARKAYEKALKLTDSATLFSAMRTYADHRRGKPEQYTAHPSTWLNEERWNDEYASNQSTADWCADLAAEIDRENQLARRQDQSAVVPLLSARNRSGC